MDKSTESIGKRALQNQINKKNIYAAMRHYLEKGQYDKITVRNICDAADLKTSSFYHIYDSFENFVYFFLADEFYDYLIAHERRLHQLNGIEKIISCYLFFIDFSHEKGIEYSRFFQKAYGMSLSIFNYSSLDNESIRTMREKLRSYYAEAVRLGEISYKYDDDVIFIYLDLIISSHLFAWCNMNGKIDIKRLTCLFFDRFFKSLNDDMYDLLAKSIRK